MPKLERYDINIILSIALLSFVGLFILSSASFGLGEERFGDPFYYLRHQLFYGFSFGIVGFLIGMMLPYRKWIKLAPILLLINVIFLILVFTPLGISHKGAARWVDFGIFSFQPSEVLKLTLTIYFAAWLTRRKKIDFGEILPISIFIIFIFLLIFLQPATTIVFVIASAPLAMLLVALKNISQLKYVMPSAAVIAFLVLFFVSTTPYRLERISAFLGLGEGGDNYQQTKAVEAISQGGLWGSGFGKSFDKYSNLPEIIGDSIFSVFANEFGFAGVLILLFLFYFLNLRVIRIIRFINDDFGRFLAIGFITIIDFQLFIHILSNAGLIPFTGMPLPFVSYGGTALAVFLTMGGILVNISSGIPSSQRLGKRFTR